MYPQLFDISTGISGLGDLVLPSYFTMVTMGFVVATLILRRFAAQHKLDKRLITDYIIWMVIWGLIGARILHVIADGHFWDYVHICTDPSLVDWHVDLPECRSLKGVWDAEKGLCHPAETYCLAWLDLRSGGLAFYGGFIAAALFSIYYIRKHRLPAGKLIDLSAWVLMLGLAWGRMGCFLASCCFGARTDSVLGVVFPGGSAASRKHWEEGLLESYRMASLPVHPTQLYEAAAGLAIAAFAYFWLHPRKRFDGQVFCVTVALYAAFRFLIEFVRRDDRGAVLGMTTSQIAAIGFLVASAYLWRTFRGRAASKNRGG